MNLYNSAGSLITLGMEIGIGSEGIVYHVIGFPLVVAKVFNTDISREKEEKLKFLITLKNDSLLKIASWPTEILYDDKKEKLIGILMPKLTGFKEIHMLYDPKSRMTEFPKAGWDFLCLASINLAKAFSTIHEYEHVVGNINPSNILVSQDAMIKFTNCDSFQFSDNGKTRHSEVDVTTYQPPELQDVKTFRSLKRTKHHDNFGLAVLIFQMLFMGRHPFSGNYLGRGEMPTEKAIKHYKFAYGEKASQLLISQPPNTFCLSYLPRKLVENFESAFSKESFIYGTRPSASDWVFSLRKLSKNMANCEKNTYHTYYQELTNCPWCDLEIITKTPMFNKQKAYSNVLTTNLEVNQIWNRINKIEPPQPLQNIKDTLNYDDILPDYRIAGYQKKKILSKVIIVSFLVVVTLSMSNYYDYISVLWAFMTTLLCMFLLQIGDSALKKDIKNQLTVSSIKLKNFENIALKSLDDKEFHSKYNQLHKLYLEYLNIEVQKNNLTKDEIIINKANLEATLRKGCDELLLLSEKISKNRKKFQEDYERHLVSFFRAKKSSSVINL